MSQTPFGFWGGLDKFLLRFIMVTLSGVSNASRLLGWVGYTSLGTYSRHSGSRLKRLSALGVGWITQPVYTQPVYTPVSQTPFGFGGGLDSAGEKANILSALKMSQTPFGFGGGLDPNGNV